MTKRILVIEGHPTAGPGTFNHALAEAYAEGARAAGNEVRRIVVGDLDVPLVRDRNEWETGSPPVDIAAAQEAVVWASHLVIIYPLWLGSMPALLKAFFEQLFRPGFAFGTPSGGAAATKRLKGRSARVVVTMGMPALVYRWWFGAHSLKSLERNILAFVGIAPVRESLIGAVEARAHYRAKWLARMRDLGRRGR